ncbi:MAG TPA: sigma 54-interacting transcriptional regulator [Candidatus Sulfotelmatobacter sp.]|nr:sigma 54-interacting transcriptional regulator [Candidatus Sulfotelmatobacter sp.]
MSAASTRIMRSAEDRYRTLLDASSTFADQPTIKAVLHSLRDVLSNSCRLHGAHLYVLGGDGETLHLLDFDREPDAPAIRIGTRISLIGAAAQALEDREIVFLPDVSQEMSRHPELAPFAAESVGRATYIFPLFTSQQRYGILVVTKDRGQEFVPEDVELLRSLASHIAVALECALARDNAELYQRQVVKERDRLRLLLEINNHIVSKLDINELFRSASASLRTYFRNDFTGFWLIDKQSNQLECVVLDFPSSKGSLTAVLKSELSDTDREKLRAHVPELLSVEEIELLPAAIVEKLKAESITSMAIAPMLTASGPRGVITMGSRQANNFGQEDLDLLSQISNQIALAVDNAIAYGRVTEARDRLEEERLYLESEIRSAYSFEDIVGKSAALRKVLDQVAIVAPTGSTVLLHGETGTGKELFARVLHNLSPRRERTFVRLNCAAIPSGLVESELFGHEKGAFTGALMQKKGRFELADHGSLFLDEIGDISLELQPKLLRALQEHEFERLGSTKTIRVDVRLIAATHRDLQAMIRNNQFREDLFYRLNVCPIEIPPLRERREDIPLLVHYFVLRHSRQMQKRVKSVPKQAMEALVNADWPGNIRQLENFIERCVIFTQGDELNVLRAELKKPSVRSIASAAPSFEQAERQAIIDALIAASGRIAGKGGAAERLGLKRTTLQNKMNKLNISRAEYSG